MRDTRCPVEQLVSGMQIVREDGEWDRVHGVSVSGGMVTVTTDRERGARYPVGTTVEVV